MGRSWRQRITLVWGGLMVATQLSIAYVFVHWLFRTWESYRALMVSYAESVNRFSQLKTPALKYPTVLVYVILFAVGIVGLVGWLLVDGARDAIGGVPDGRDDSDEAR